MIGNCPVASYLVKTFRLRHAVLVLGMAGDDLLIFFEGLPAQALVV